MQKIVYAMVQSTKNNFLWKVPTEIAKGICALINKLWSIAYFNS